MNKKTRKRQRPALGLEQRPSKRRPLERKCCHRCGEWSLHFYPKSESPWTCPVCRAAGF